MLLPWAPWPSVMTSFRAPVTVLSLPPVPDSFASLLRSRGKVFLNFVSSSLVQYYKGFGQRLQCEYVRGFPSPSNNSLDTRASSGSARSWHHVLGDSMRIQTEGSVLPGCPASHFRCQLQTQIATCICDQLPAGYRLAVPTTPSLDLRCQLQFQEVTSVLTDLL